ncbi:MAG: DUF4268 domain-containing protein [Clostridia bacterium]|nr:DUF4268 domain-containing protein [Clostridia bacterium]
MDIEREINIIIITTIVTVVPVELIVLDKTSLRLCMGEEKLLHATVLPDNATNKAVIWSSSDSSVATVKNGMVTACGEGACTVTATAEDGGFTVNCSISVLKYQTPDTIGRNISLDVFWNTFEQILIENGEPFKIIHEKAGEQTHWACVNKNKALNNNCVDISLVRREGFLRVGLYIIDRNARIGQILLANKENIDRQISFEHIWEDGTRNPNTLRIIKKFPIAGKTSREIIENALPYIMKYVEIAKIYGEHDFFDF